MTTEHTANSTLGLTEGPRLDLALAIVLAASGTIALALSRHGVSTLQPDLLGSATVGVLAVVLARAARFPYRGVIATTLGIVLIQVAASVAMGIQPAMVIAYPLLAVGILGLLESTAWLRATSMQRQTEPRAAARTPLPAAQRRRSFPELRDRLAAG